MDNKKNGNLRNRVKKYNGEKAAQRLGRLGLLSPRVVEIMRYAGHFSKQELIPNEIIAYLQSLDKPPKEEQATAQDPFELLKQAGYTKVIVADTAEKKNDPEFMKLFAEGEELCTFIDSGRHENYYILHCIRENAWTDKNGYWGEVKRVWEGVDTLWRENFRGIEQRQDEYGTSAISIQIARNGNFISIKNRYNSKVGDCDATFGNHLDQIIPGLKQALEERFDVKINAPSELPKGYCLMNGQIIRYHKVRYHKEQNNVYFGADFYAKDGVIYPIEKDYQIICEDVILDFKNKQIINPADSYLGDCLAEELSHIQNLTVSKDKENGTPIVKADGEDFLKIKEGRLIEAKLRHVTEIGESTFDGCKSLTSVVIPEGVERIGYGAFRDCSSLTSVDIPKGVTEIGNRAFLDCTSLTGVNIPEGVERIGEHAFWGCSSLTSVDIPEGVTEIGEWAFSGCSSLTSVVIPDGVKTIGYRAFYGCSSLKEVVIPKGVERIGDDAFGSCKSLTSVVIPQGVTEIGNYAFLGCTSLTSVVIPNDVKIIDYGAFGGCSSLTSVDIPKGVTEIGEWAFANCSSLKEVVIPEGVKTIGIGAFEDCSSNLVITCATKEQKKSVKNSGFKGKIRIQPQCVAAQPKLSYFQNAFNFVKRCLTR